MRMEYLVEDIRVDVLRIDEKTVDVEDTGPHW